MFWSLFWRALLLMLAFNLLAVLGFKNTQLFTNPEYIQWKAPLLWGCFALALFGFWAITRKSPISLVFGKRLGKSDAFWSIANHVLVAILFTITALSLAITQLFSFNTWNGYKLVAPFIGLALFSFLVPRWGVSK